MGIRKRRPGQAWVDLERAQSRKEHRRPPCAPCLGWLCPSRLSALAKPQNTVVFKFAVHLWRSILAVSRHFLLLSRISSLKRKASPSGRKARGREWCRWRRPRAATRPLDPHDQWPARTFLAPRRRRPTLRSAASARYGTSRRIGSRALTPRSPSSSTRASSRWWQRTTRRFWRTSRSRTA